MGDTVYVGKCGDCYHTSKTCRGLESGYETLREWDRETAEAWKDICTYCAGEFDPNRNGSMVIYD